MSLSRRCACFNSILVRLKVFYQHTDMQTWTRFNSILVRLKGSISSRIRRTSHLFQFHTGSIKSSKSRDKWEPIHCFNSILVRLKEKKSFCVSCYTPLFQFHTGSIKSIFVKSKGVASHMFQFHTGSIKSLAGLPVSPDHNGFNSILVRLKECYGW